MLLLPIGETYLFSRYSSANHIYITLCGLSNLYLFSLGAGVHTKLLTLSLTLCHPVGCSLSGSSVHVILEVRILEWVAISFSRGSSQPRDQPHVF